MDFLILAWAIDVCANILPGENVEPSPDFCPTGEGKFQPSLNKAWAPEICNSILET